jgi:mRNA interferase MazF
MLRACARRLRDAPVDGANGLSEPSVVSCDNVTTIPAEALRDRIGMLLDDQERQFAAAIRAAFDLD